MVVRYGLLAFARFALSLSLASAFCGATARCETASPNKRAEIKEILVKMNAINSAKQGMNALAPALLEIIRGKHPEMTSEQSKAILDIFKGVINEQAGSVQNLVIDAYDETFSPEEIDTLYKFYSSPSGSVIAMKTSAAQQNARLKGQTWGQGIFAPEVLKRMKANPSLNNLAQ